MVHQSDQTLVEALNRASFFLGEHDHNKAMAQTYWLHYKDWNLTDLITHLYDPIDLADEANFFELLKRIVADEPLQYILGYADFMDKRFKVTSDTLIPREETAGVVTLARDFLKVKPKAHVLDIGTGTGIIAVMLGTEFKDSQITAVDISQPALDVAKENARGHGVNIDFVKSDLTNQLNQDQTYDLIVSNPPYIGADEVEVMDESVKKYEPRLALFAENKGLAVYERLARELPEYVSENGMIILEIGYNQGKEVQDLFEQAFPTANVKVHKDFNQHDRYVIVK